MTLQKRILCIYQKDAIKDMTLKGDFYKGSLSNLKSILNYGKKAKEFLKKNHHIYYEHSHVENIFHGCFNVFNYFI